jgi:hypothetical protein
MVMRGNLRTSHWEGRTCCERVRLRRGNDAWSIEAAMDYHAAASNFEW